MRNENIFTDGKTRILENRRYDLIAGSYRARGLKDDKISLFNIRDDGANRLLYVAHVRFMVLSLEWRRNRDNEHIGCLGFERRLQISRVDRGLEKDIQARFNDMDMSRIDRFDDIGSDIDTNDLIALGTQ